jgi:topoisomerase-4 subunit A
MTDQTTIDHKTGIECIPLHVFTEKAYLDYSMYVILDRALPHLGDGLKPVQRRILYAMSELKLSANAKFKKSARTIGDVLGKFHPHGDSACYEAMVLMAQPFSYRYPLINGQGNWGSSDEPKSFAAMRYTEARLTAYADTLLAEINAGAVDWQANFDSTLQEPTVLPARLPNIIINGASGIAVGMATDIPPHNLNEVVAACLQLLKKPETDLKTLLQQLPGPDYPTQADLISTPDDLYQLYATGKGTIRLRSRYYIEQQHIIINALPYQVSGNRIMEQIAEQLRTKQLPMLDDVRDESDHEHAVRLVLIPRSSNVNTTDLMLHLFATTDLEKTYRVNMNIINTKGRPEVMNLKQILTTWLDYRQHIVKRRLQHRLDQVKHRLHLISGLLTILTQLDAALVIIRQAEEPQAQLMSEFGLTATQADFILNTRLRQLARFEEQQLLCEQAALTQEQQQLNGYLHDPAQLSQLIQQELEQDARQYGDRRQTQLIQQPPASAKRQEHQTASEPITVILSERGWIRAARGHELDPRQLSYKNGDHFLTAVQTLNNQSVIVYDDHGRSYSLSTQGLPSVRSQGEPLTGRLEPPRGARFIALLANEPERHYLIASVAGHGFICTGDRLVARPKTGKAIMTVADNVRVFAPAPLPEAIDGVRLALINLTGHLLVITIDQIPLLSRGKGYKLIDLKPSQRHPAENHVVALQLIPKGAGLRLRAGKRFFVLKASDLDYYQGQRGQRGSLLPRGLQRIDSTQIEI